MSVPVGKIAKKQSVECIFDNMTLYTKGVI